MNDEDEDPMNDEDEDPMNDEENPLGKGPPHGHSPLGPLPPGRNPYAQTYVLLRGEHSFRLTTQLSKHQLIYSTLGLVLGLVCVIGGVVLFLAGVSGKMSWTAKFLGASSELLDAAPGAVLFIVGLFVVYVTRFRVKSQR